MMGNWSSGRKWSDLINCKGGYKKVLWCHCVYSHPPSPLGSNDGIKERLLSVIGCMLSDFLFPGRNVKPERVNLWLNSPEATKWMEINSGMSMMNESIWTQCDFMRLVWDDKLMLLQSKYSGRLWAYRRDKAGLKSGYSLHNMAMHETGMSWQNLTSTFPAIFEITSKTISCIIL